MRLRAAVLTSYIFRASDEVHWIISVVKKHMPEDRGQLAILHSQAITYGVTSCSTPAYPFQLSNLQIFTPISLLDFDCEIQVIAALKDPCSHDEIEAYCIFSLCHIYFKSDKIAVNTCTISL